MMLRAALGLGLAALLAGAQPRRPPAMDRWQKMTPAQKQGVLNRLPPERRQNLQRRLQLYEKMPPQDRQALERRYEWFQSLPPERQELARDLFRRLQELKPARQQLVRNEFQRLRNLPAGERHPALQTPEVRRRFRMAERDLLGDFVRLLDPAER
jgi:predicted Fe-S protein YdhL (DUF1289 family)